jgi:hypothetical protein
MDQSKICIKKNCNEICFKDYSFCKKHFQDCFKLYKKYKEICLENYNYIGKLKISDINILNIQELKDLLKSKVKEYNQLNKCIQTRENHLNKCYGDKTDEGHLQYLKYLKEKLDICENNLHFITESIEKKINEEKNIIEIKVKESKNSDTTNFKSQSQLKNDSSDNNSSSGVSSSNKPNMKSKNKKKKKKIQLIPNESSLNLINEDININLKNEIEEIINYINKNNIDKKELAYKIYLYVNIKEKENGINKLPDFPSIEDYLLSINDIEDLIEIKKLIISKNSKKIIYKIILENETPDTLFLGEYFTIEYKNINENEIIRISIKYPNLLNTHNNIIYSIPDIPCNFNVIYEINKKLNFTNNKYINNYENILFNDFKMINVYNNYEANISVILMEKNVDNLRLINKINKDILSYRLYNGDTKKNVYSNTKYRPELFNFFREDQFTIKKSLILFIISTQNRNKSIPKELINEFKS